MQILNVDLTNEKSIDASFSARLGDTFIVSDGGRAYMNFGKYRPGGPNGVGVFNGEGAPTSGSYEKEDNNEDNDSSESEDNDSSIPFNYPNDSIYGYLDAVIDSSSAKTLAQPTLLCRKVRRLRLRLVQCYYLGVDNRHT